MNNDRTYRVAILGATGAVGREMMKVMEEYRFPVSELLALASAKSAGKKLPFMGGEVTVREATEDAFEGVDIVLGAVESEHAKRFAPAIVRAGALFIDNSSAFRLDPDVPLVVPDINPEDIFKNKGIIANPNCSTIIAMVALAPLARLSKIETAVCSTYQAVSGAGVGGMRDLEEGVRAWAEGREAVLSTFPHPIAFNLIPAIGGEKEDGYTSEELKMQNEGRKILHLPDLRVTCTCVRVPVLRSHAVSAAIVTERAISVAEAREALKNAPGVVLADDLAAGDYPMPLRSTGGDAVYVGRIRKDLTSDRGLALFCCGDQLRKGAASNAVQIALRLTGRQTV